MSKKLILCLSLLLIGCNAPDLNPELSNSADDLSVESAAEPTSILGPTATTIIPTATPTITPEPTLDYDRSNPLAAYSVPALRQRDYDGGMLELGTRIAITDRFEQWTFTHMSEDFQGNRVEVTGLVNIPIGEGPFPVAIVLHGGITQSAYEQGAGSAIHANLLAENGYVAFMPDYQTYNETEGSGSPLKIPWAVDIMHLIDVIPDLPQADPERIGIMGHSRGGGIATHLMVISEDVDATVLYASLHVDQDVVWDQYNFVFNVEWPQLDAQTWGSPETNPEGYVMVSPGSYLDLVSAPVQIHHGDQDFTTPLSWAIELERRLDVIGKDVELFEYPGGLHTFGESDHQLMMSRVVTFFNEEVR